MTTITKTHTLIIGAGASGLMAGISAAKTRDVIICEKMPKPGLKILASGGERCNVTNTLDHDTYMEHFGRHGRFMSDALKLMGNQALIKFFHSIGIETKSRDGFRVFPASHKSQTVLDGLLGEFKQLGGEIHLNSTITKIEKVDDHWVLQNKDGHEYNCKKLIIATGGLSASHLGSTGDGYQFAEILGHKVTDQSPGGVALKTLETWPKQCRADTIGKALLYVDIKKHQKISLIGDVIFTPNGIAGKLILDISREITPLLKKYEQVPIILQMRPQLNQQDWQDLFQNSKKKNELLTIGEIATKHLPKSIIYALSEEVGLSADQTVNQISPQQLMDLITILNKTPLTITDSLGYKVAFVTTGGVKLKEVSPVTLESKLIKDLYFCGEVLDLAGPCGGYNLQWAFASGYLAGTSAAD